MDIAELQMYAKSYAKKVNAITTAMDDGDTDAVQELLDESLRSARRDRTDSGVPISHSVPSPCSHPQADP